MVTMAIFPLLEVNFKKHSHKRQLPPPDILAGLAFHCAEDQSATAWHAPEKFVATNSNLCTRHDDLPEEGQREFVATNFPLPLPREGRP